LAPTSITVKTIISILILTAATAIALPEGLLLHYSFDKDGEKNAIPDSSGAKLHGKRIGGRWLSDGKSGGSYQFWGKGNHITTPKSETLQLKQGTFALWFKTDRSDPDGFPLIHHMADGKGISLGLSGDSKVKFSRSRIAFSIDGCPPVLSNYVLADGSWHHAAGTYDGKHLRLYIDGKPQKQTATAPTLNAPDAPVLIATGPEATKTKRTLFGTVDEVMIFNRSLSPEEIHKMVTDIDPEAGKLRFTKKQIQGRLRQLERLYKEGLLRKDFYDRKVNECDFSFE
jgi:hypothetical protein